MRVLHVISSLGVGGAERALERLVKDLPSPDFAHTVISLTALDAIGERLRERGVAVHALGMRKSISDLRALYLLGDLTRSIQPDLIQGWLYHGNLAACLAPLLARHKAPVVWNIRHSLNAWDKEKWSTQAVIRLGGKASSGVKYIIYNAKISVEQHARFGYPQDKATVIPNGFDCEYFVPDSGIRSATRGKIGFDTGDVVVGMLGRVHPLKDHGNFLRAARIVRDRNPRARFLLVGRGMQSRQSGVVDLIKRLNLEADVTVLEQSQDVLGMLNAMDIYVSSSSAEGFPNVVAEAMACGVPCVVTDVGASAELVGDAGLVVPPRESQALADKILQLIEAGEAARANLGARSRKLIQQSYDHRFIAEQYGRLYRAVVDGHRASTSFQPRGHL